VLDNGDGTVAFRCAENGLFLNQATVLFNYDGSSRDFCTEPGVCPTCKFYLQCGSITQINLQILDIRLEYSVISIRLKYLTLSQKV
jgi:hypothetical protein